MRLEIERLCVSTHHDHSVKIKIFHENPVDIPPEDIGYSCHVAFNRPSSKHFRSVVYLLRKDKNSLDFDMNATDIIKAIEHVTKLFANFGIKRIVVMIPNFLTKKEDKVFDKYRFRKSLSGADTTYYYYTNYLFDRIKNETVVKPKLSI